MIIDRRHFLEAMPALLPPGLFAAEEGRRKIRFYLLEQFFLENGSQPGRIHDFFSKALLPAMERIHKGPKLFLDAIVAPHMPQVAVIFGVESCDRIWSVAQALFSDPQFQRAFDRWEEGEPPYVSASASLLEATPYSPEILAPEKPAAVPRIFELRTYHSPTARQLKALHGRFAGPEIKIFHRVGVHPLLYTTSVFGDDRPNLTYLIPFDTLAAREKAWNAFAADEEWQRVRQESIARSGQISSVIRISLYRATPYSPIR
ncbi:MAG: NIPSNAP family protein [Acidobacteria bacterium]|nr:NIPSNAP family protein [Acidobacteriota bacterium]